jgi:peptidoglycan/LPS O-acetylase OafA/YrhL
MRRNRVSPRAARSSAQPAPRARQRGKLSQRSSSFLRSGLYLLSRFRSLITDALHRHRTPTTGGLGEVTSQLTQPKYRADIDGLRAIAVLSVVGFHAFPKWVKGGFIGVDIFFVISGFLISTIIFANLERNRFSFVEFYSRRVKRIFPALLLVLIASFAFGWFALPPDEYKQLGKHIAAGAGFISNLVLWNESGYFDDAAETKPLLHLWSLGIEEQFYILWPFLLWLAWKRRFNLLLITVTVATVSFALNIFKIHSDPVATFYSLQTRLWELSIGSILAYVALFNPSALQRLHLQNKNVQSLCGFALLAVGVLLITIERAFPGWWALLPTVGTALVISAGSQAAINRSILSNGVLVWFGLISYPLYLWHRPLLTFAHIVEEDIPSPKIRITAVAISILLAWLTYKLIEKPIRFGTHGKAKTITLIVLMTAVAFVGYDGFKRDGFISRPGSLFKIRNDGDIGHETFLKYQDRYFYRCTPTGIQRDSPVWGDQVRCFQSKKSELKDIAIIGDSHAEHLFIGLAEQLSSVNIVYYLQNSLPVVSNREFEKIFKYVVEDKNITTVILTAFWIGRINSVPENSTLEKELIRTVNELTAAGKKVYVTDDVPNFSFPAKQCKYESNWIHTNRCVEDKEVFFRQYQKYFPILELVKEKANVQILKTAAYFCNEKFCSMERDRSILFSDRDHLSIRGSKYLGKMIVENNPELARLK